MAKISRIKCKFCGTYMEKKQTECPSCGKSKNSAVATCVECGKHYDVDQRDFKAGYCAACDKKRSRNKILMKLAIIAAFCAAITAYKLLKVYAP